MINEAKESSRNQEVTKLLSITTRVYNLKIIILIIIHITFDIYAEINTIFIYSANMCGAELINRIRSALPVNMNTREREHKTRLCNIFHSPGDA